MKTSCCPLEGIVLIEPMIFNDARGLFLECFQDERYRNAGMSDRFIQSNHSRSKKNVLRGLHYTKRKPQVQLLTVMNGTIFDVVVDLRLESKSYGKWFGTLLGDGEWRQIYMPHGFAHGFCVLSDWADLHYKVSQYYDEKDEGGLIWNDKDLEINWPISNPIMSKRDKEHPTLRSLLPVQLPVASIN